MAKRLAFALVVALLLVTPLAAATTADEVKWTRVGIPGEGRSGGWLLAPGTDINCLTATGDGTLYACGQGTAYTIYKSADGGASWTAIEEADDMIVALAASPADAGTIYYATENAVFQFTDSDKSIRLADSPGEAGIGNIAITALAVTAKGDGNLLAVATRDSDAGQFGGIYITRESGPLPTWEDTRVGSYDVYAVAFSPDYASDRQLVAVVSDETNTMVTTRTGTAGWGQTTGDAILESSGEPVAAVTSATIAFPDDYDAGEGYTQFVAIDTGEDRGDVYRIIGTESPEPSAVFDLNIGDRYGREGVDVTGLAVSGQGDDARLIAGAAGSAETYFSTDGGSSWRQSIKPPTGEEQTYVVLNTEDDLAYAATSGQGSAVSISRDGGATWNQNGLIDTEIASIIDAAPSPDYHRDETLFLLTWGGGKHSLWRSLDDGESWERTFSTGHAGVDEIDRVALPTDYGESNLEVYLAGSGAGQPAVWYSDDNGQEFARRDTPLAIDTWTVAADRTLFLGGFDGTNGRIYRSSNGGRSYTSGTAVGEQPLHSIALSPDYADDGIILAGNTNGWVFMSDDCGRTFTSLPDDAATAPFTGSITLAFDPDFSDNGTVYAASDSPDGGIHRLRRGKDTEWESIDDSLPEESLIGQLKLDAEGTLYAANFLTDGGLERCLNPTYSSPTFETVTRGLSDGATLVGLWIVGDQLWTIDTTNNRLLCYTDSLTVPVVLTALDDEAPGMGTVNDDTVGGVSLDWATLPGANLYQWQLNYETGFSSLPDGFEGESSGTSARLPDLDPATTYYWRVRAVEPVFSPWSDKWSFTTSLGTSIAAPRPQTPMAGASAVNPRPVFQWSSIAGADSYELVIATDSAFENPVISRTGEQSVPATAWECDTDLTIGETYFWKVRARSQNSYSAWSDVYAFNTATSSLSSQTNQPTSQAPAPPAKPETDWTRWLVIIGIALLAVMAALLATLIVLVFRIRRF